MGLFGLYDKTDLDSIPESDSDSFEMMVLPGAFVNLGKRTVQFHADYSMEQRFLHDSEDLTFHTGNVSFLYMPSRNWTITAADEVRSAPSNLLSLTGGFSPGLPVDNPVGPGISGYSYERVLMNRGSAEVRYRLGRKTHISAYGNSHIFRYEANSTNDTDAYNIGSNLNRTLNRKLDASIGFMYGEYDNESGSRDHEIKRLSGGLGYLLGRFWRIQGNAGVEWVQTPSHSYMPQFYSSSLGRTTDSSIFAISYTRAAQYQLGTSQLTKTDTISSSLDKRLTLKSSILIGAHYYRSKPYVEGTDQNTLIAGAGFKYALLPNILASINGNYQYQDRAYNLENSPSFNRYIVYAGIEVIVPGINSR